MNVTIDLAKKHIKDKPDDADVLRASLIKVIRLFEEQEKQLLLHNVSQQRELLMREIEKYHNWYTSDNNGKEYAKEYLNSINCG